MGTASSTPLEETHQEDPWWSHGSQSEPVKVTETISATKNVQVTSETVSSSETVVVDEERRKINAQKLEEYRKDSAKKHAERREILAAKKMEMMNLREELVQQKKENEELKKQLEFRNGNVDTFDTMQICQPIQQMPKCDCSVEIDNLQKENEDLKSRIVQYSEDLKQTEEIAQKNLELRVSIAETQKELQQINSEVISFEKERHDYQVHVVALKDVIRVSKQMLQIRESQLQEVCSIHK